MPGSIIMKLIQSLLLSASLLFLIACGGGSSGGNDNSDLEYNPQPLPEPENPQLWDYKNISYGDEERQWLNIHLAESASPTPVYLFAHGNGGTANGMSLGQLNAIVSAGYTTVSWESIATIGADQDTAIAWDDAQLMFDWVRANAATYNLDPDYIVVGGRSRGSIVSWPLFHSGHPAIKGGYFYNALPQGTWVNTDIWSPVDNITNDSPLTYFAFGPDREDDDGHNPIYADPVLEKYEELGIETRITVTEGMWDLFYDANGQWANDAQIMEYFPTFVATLEGKSGLNLEEALALTQQMFVASYGRPATPDEQGDWAKNFQTSNDISQTLDAFGNSPEFQENYDFLSSSEQVNTLYHQIFSRDAEPAELDFYIGILEAEEASLASITKQIADDATGSDLQSLQNKVEVANYFTDTVEENNYDYTAAEFEDTQSIIASVNDHIDSLIEGKASVDNYFYAFSPSPVDAEGYNSLFMGHSFFVPIARQIPFHAEQLGLDRHTQYIEMSGGVTGTPTALWNDEGHRSNIQAVLGTGEVELLGMTFENNPALEGYVRWIDYALSQNPNTKFVIGLPWRDYPGNYFDAESYAGDGTVLEVWKSQLVTLRLLYPDNEIISMPYGFAAFKLRYMFEAGDLPGITDLIGNNPATSLFKDRKGHGHAGGLLLDLAEFIWLISIYSIDLDTYDYDAGHPINLKAVANSILIEYAEYFE
jgi:hypothetical protein